MKKFPIIIPAVGVAISILAPLFPSVIDNISASVLWPVRIGLIVLCVAYIICTAINEVKTGKYIFNPNPVAPKYKWVETLLGRWYAYGGTKRFSNFFGRWYERAGSLHIYCKDLHNWAESGRIYNALMKKSKERKFVMYLYDPSGDNVRGFIEAGAELNDVSDCFFDEFSFSVMEYAGSYRAIIREKGSDGLVHVKKVDSSETAKLIGHFMEMSKQGQEDVNVKR
jgi:hypothetical protein